MSQATIYQFPKSAAQLAEEDFRADMDDAAAAIDFIRTRLFDHTYSRVVDQDFAPGVQYRLAEIANLTRSPASIDVYKNISTKVNSLVEYIDQERYLTGTDARGIRHIVAELHNLRYTCNLRT